MVELTRHLASHDPSPPRLPDPGAPFSRPDALPFWLTVEWVTGQEVGLFINYVCTECGYTHAVNTGIHRGGEA